MAKKSAPKKRRAKKRPVSNDTSKAQAIRDAAKELGKKARPRDIVAALKVKGTTVTYPQVGAVLKAAGLRKGRRRKKIKARVAAHNGHGCTFDVRELRQVKKLAAQLGGTEKLKELAGALERLI